MNNILVTGGAGFIGSHTCLVLLENGYNVIVIDSFENSSQKSLVRVSELNKNKFNNKIQIFKGSLCDQKFLLDVFKRIKKRYKKIDGVIHFAGVKSVAESVTNPILYWKINLIGTINLLDKMMEFGCQNIVFSSSATIYQTDNLCLLKESSKIGPINPYGNTKYAIEELLHDLFKYSREKWKIASLRYFNPIGAHESGLLGEDPKGTPNNIFPLINNTALGIQKELIIFGNDWPTKDGTAIRDYIHVMDLAEAHVKILKFLSKKKSTFLKINVGTGKGTSVLDLIKTFEVVNNVKLPYIFKSRRPGDVAHLVSDNSFLKSKLHINPKRSLIDMCRDGWKWKRLNPDGY